MGGRGGGGEGGNCTVSLEHHVQVRYGVYLCYIVSPIRRRYGGQTW